MPGGVTIEVNVQKEPYVFVSKAAEEAKKKREQRLLEIAEQKKRLEEELKSRTEQEKNANAQALDAIEKKLKEDKAAAERQLMNQLASDMEKLTNDIMSRFPWPSLSLAIIDNDAENLQNTNPDRFRFTFRKSDIATLNETKAYKKNMLFGSNKPNVQFDAVQRDLAEFSELMSQMSSQQEEIDLTKNAERLETLFNQIQKNCQKYLDDHPGSRSTPTGKARKKLISDTKEIIASKMEVFLQMRNRKEEQLQGADEALKKLHDDSVAELGNNIDRANDALNSAAEKSRKDQADNHAGALRQIDDDYKKKKEDLENLEKAEKKPVRPQYKIQRHVAERSVRPIPNEEDANVSDTERAIFLQGQIAHVFFNREHNPFLSYRRQFKPSFDPHFSICDDSYQTMPKIDEVKAQLNSINSNVPMTYSIDALMTIANLEQFDYWMGIKRTPHDFHIGYVIKDMNGKEYSMEEMNQLGEKEIKDNRIQCIVTAVQAEIKYDSKDPFEFLDRSEMFRFKSWSLGNREILENMIAFRSSRFDDVFSCSEKQKSTLRHRLEDGIRIFETWNVNNGDFANIYSREELLHSVSTGYIGTKPILPSFQLSKKKEDSDAKIYKWYQPEFMENGGAYYDEDLLFQMKPQFSIDKRLPVFNIDKDILEKELYENRLALTNQQFGQELNGFKDTEDKNLSAIITGIQDACRLAPRDTVDFGDFHQSVYDREANRLYKMASVYVSDHPGTKETKVLQAWLDKTFPKGTMKDEKEPEAYYIDATSTNSDDISSESRFNGDADLLFSAKLVSADDTVTMYDAKEEPLFTKEPSVGDIQQGRLGNCYFLAQLASAAKDNPNAIREMMVENPDGTVTCKFHTDYNEAVYVKVNKTYPVSKTGKSSKLSTGERVPLWVSVLEKAYVLSGLRDEAHTDSEERDFLVDEGCKTYKKKENWPDNLNNSEIIDKLIEKRFPGKKVSDAADRMKKMHRIFRHGYLSLNTGKSRVVGRHLFGKQGKIIQTDVSESKVVLDSFQNLKRDDRLEKITEALTGKNLNCDKAMLGELLTLAGSLLRTEKYHAYMDDKQHLFSMVKYISLEDVKKSIEKAGIELSKDNAYKKEDVDSLVKAFNTEMEKYQSDKPGELKLLSETPKNYSKDTIDLYNSLKLHRDLKLTVNCSFRNINCYDDHQNAIHRNILQSMEQGAILRHSYSVLNVREDENGTKYVQLRNPWGHGEVTHFQMKGRDDTERVMITGGGKSTGINPAGGVFELELNQFVKHVDEIIFMKDLKLLTFGSLCGKIAEQYISYLKKEKTDTYNKLMQGCNQDEKKLIVRASKSKKIHTASKSFLNRFREELEAGRKIDIAEFRKNKILNADLDNLEPADVKKQNPGFDNPNLVAANGSVNVI